jgi:hypothetical protein
MKRIFGTLVIISLLACIAQQRLFCVPDSELVTEEHAKILKELGYEREVRIPDPITDFIRAVLNFFHESPLLGILLLTAFILLLGYLLGRFTHVFRKNPLEMEKLKEAKDGKTGSTIGQQYLELCKHARSLAEQGEYGTAIVSLHKASIVYLKIKKILFFGEYQTNNEIKRELKKKNGFYEPFAALALQAERITFRAERITQDRYRKLYEVYRRSFTL